MVRRKPSQKRERWRWYRRSYKRTPSRSILISLMTTAIQNSPTKMLTPSEIYQFVVTGLFSDSTEWQNSISRSAQEKPVGRRAETLSQHYLAGQLLVPAAIGLIHGLAHPFTFWFPTRFPFKGFCPAQSTQTPTSKCSTEALPSLPPPLMAKTPCYVGWPLRSIRPKSGRPNFGEGQSTRRASIRCKAVLPPPSLKTSVVPWPSSN